VRNRLQAAETEISQIIKRKGASSYWRDVMVNLGEIRQSAEQEINDMRGKLNQTSARGRNY